MKIWSLNTMSKHAPYGGSTIHRTINCPAWRQLADKTPAPPASDAAALGTVLHKIVEDCLNDVDYVPAPGVYDGITIDQDMMDTKIFPAVEAFEDLFAQFKCEETGRIQLEKWVQLADDIGGTADVLALSDDGKTLLVGDYKSGDGVLVNALGNDQGLFYAACALESWDDHDLSGVEKVAIAIVQPSERKEEICELWVTSVNNVVEFKRSALAAIEAAKKPSPETKAGSWCRFCPAHAICPIKQGLPAKVERLPVNSLEVKQLSDALHIADEVEQWVAAVRKMAHEQMELGVPIKGFKLVHKRATRQWADPVELEKALKKSRKINKNDTYVSKLVSPAQLEKVCKQKGVDFAKYSDYAVSVSSGTTLAPESDKRPAALPSAGLKALAAKI
jgi:hypothetical protein